MQPASTRVGLSPKLFCDYPNLLLRDNYQSAKLAKIPETAKKSATFVLVNICELVFLYGIYPSKMTFVWHL